MSAMSTAEFERLSLIAAGVDPSQIPPILDTATWRRMLIAGLLKNAANQAISGQVDNYSQLPTTVSAPAIGATYLVKYSSGIYYINYKSAGIYVRVADTGSLSDWVYAPLSSVGTLPDAEITDPQAGDTFSYDGEKWSNSKKFSRYTYLASDSQINTSLGGPNDLTLDLTGVLGKTYYIKWNIGTFGPVTVSIQARFNPALVLGGISASNLPNETIRNFVGGSSGVFWAFSNSSNFGSRIIEVIVQPTSNLDFSASLTFIGSALGGSIKAGSWMFVQEI
jgi:hypothetical protein